jgi:hypothetical protein
MAMHKERRSNTNRRMRSWGGERKKNAEKLPKKAKKVVSK